MEWIEIKIEEYKILRSEINNLVKIQYTLISLGFTVIGGLAGYGLTRPQNILSIVIFLLGIPLLSNIVLFLWTGAVRRTLRNASYCYIIESEVAKVIKKTKNISRALNWEHWVNKLNRNQKNKKKNNQEKLDYFIIFALFLIFSLTSLLFGSFFYSQNKEWYVFLSLNVVILYSIVFLILSILFFFFRGLEILKNYG